MRKLFWALPTRSERKIYLKSTSGVKSLFLQEVRVKENFSLTKGGHDHTLQYKKIGILVEYRILLILIIKNSVL